METTKPKVRKGFACMSLERRTAAARKGGAGVAPGNRSFSRNPTLAAEAGRKGGLRSKGGGRPPASPA